MQNNRRARCACKDGPGFSAAGAGSRGLRHPSYTRVPPGCPRGCNEDKSLAYLINSRRSRVQSRALSAFSAPLAAASLPLHPPSSGIVNRIESEFLPAQSRQRRNPYITYSLLILALMRSRHEWHGEREAFRQISTKNIAGVEAVRSKRIESSR